MKSLSLYQQQIALLKKQREALDEDFAQVLAEGLNEGHSISDLLNAPSADKNQQSFDL